MNRAVEVATPLIAVVSGGPAMEKLLLRGNSPSVSRKSVYAFASLKLRQKKWLAEP
jgi:hypothetical protein